MLFLGRLPDQIFSHFLRIFSENIGFWDPTWAHLAPKMAPNPVKVRKKTRIFHKLDPLFAFLEPPGAPKVVTSVPQAAHTLQEPQF